MAAVTTTATTSRRPPRSLTRVVAVNLAKYQSAYRRRGRQWRCKKARAHLFCVCDRVTPIIFRAAASLTQRDHTSRSRESPCARARAEPSNASSLKYTQNVSSPIVDLQTASARVNFWRRVWRRPRPSSSSHCSVSIAAALTFAVTRAPSSSDERRRRETSDTRASAHARVYA